MPINDAGEKKKRCEFSVIRYVPDPVKEEFVNIGLIFIDNDSVTVRFTTNWDRVRNFDKSADIEMLKALEDELRQRLSQGGKYQEGAFADLQDRCSNALQFTERKACLCTDAGRELESLARLYL
jgi:DUF3037 family protein